MAPWCCILSRKRKVAAVAPAIDPAAHLQLSSGVSGGNVADPESPHVAACPTASPQGGATLSPPAPVPADGVPAEQPQRRHHRADLRTPEQADPSLQPHPDRAAAALHREGAARMELSLDLEAEWVTALAFLLQVHNEPLMAHEAVMRNAMQRYEQCWLPLLASHGSGGGDGALMAAPFDVAWAWWAHALAPEPYRQDVETVTGSSGTSGAWAAHLAAPQRRPPEAVAASRKLWNASYPEEPYDVDLAALVAAPRRVEGAGLVAASSTGDSPSKICYGIMNAMERQTTFYYDVALPHYVEPWFIRRAVARYRQFLYLKLLFKNEFISPPYDLDLLWHLHMAFHVLYHADCMRIFGGVFGHDDAVNDRTIGGKLETSWLKTQELWWQSYGNYWSADGAMYRERAPQLYDSPDRSVLAASRLSGPATQLRDREFILHPLEGDGPIMPSKPHDFESSEPVAVVLRAQPQDGGIPYLILLQHEGIRSQSAAVQVIPEGSQSAEASARLVGRETLPLARTEMRASSPALERQRVILPGAHDSENLLNPEPAAVCAAPLQPAALEALNPKHPQLLDADASHQSHSGRDDAAQGSEAAAAGRGCQCASGAGMSGERAFVVSTAEADWGVSIAAWGVPSPGARGGSPEQLQVRLHRLDAGSGACTSVWQQSTELEEDIRWDFNAPKDPSRASSSAETSNHTTPVSVRLGVGSSPPSVLVSAGEDAPAALAFASALALQAMMLGLAAAEGEEDTRVFWKGLLASSGVGPAVPSER